MGRNYPTIDLIVRHGSAIAAVLGALPLIVVAAVVFGLDLPLWLLLPGLGASVIAWFLAKSYVELVHVMSEMLLPK